MKKLLLFVGVLVFALPSGLPAQRAWELLAEGGTEPEPDYPINYDKATATLTRTDRRMNGASMNGTTYTLPSDRFLYHEDMAKTFFATPGETLTPQFAYTGTWMNGYVYIDRDRDGDFSYTINGDGTPATGSDLMTYSHYRLKNSAGQSVSGNARNVLNPPSFTLPGLEDGFYRIRFKIDWDEIHPGGNTTGDDNILQNGGGIADARLRVYSGTDVSLTLTEHHHGTLTTTEHTPLPDSVPFHTALPIAAAPHPGFRIDSLYIAHGDFTGQAVIHSVPQRITTIYTIDNFQDGLFTIPADMVDGDLQLHATFIPDDGYVPPVSPTLSAETAAGGLVRYFDGTELTSTPIAVPEGQDITILLHNDTGYTLTALQLSSTTGDECDVPVSDLNLNRYDIPAYLFEGKAQVVVTPTFTPLPDGETRAVQRWQLVWNDEFESDGYAKPDTEKWGTPKRRSSAWNRFIADTDSTSFLRDGYYHARCFANTDLNNDNVAMLSGAIQSSGLYNFRYGRVEARIKTTRHKGNFPAFWMMPQDNSAGWPNAGEIDVWEQINRDNYAHHTVHSNWTYNLGKKNDPKSTSSEWADMDGWHVYALEWDATQLRWYLDGNQVFSYNKKADNQDALSKGQWPFDAPFYIILNQSVGNGSWASTPDESFTYETLFDYVRVYQIQKTGSDGTVYPINYPKTQAVTHPTRRLNAVGIDNEMLGVPNPSCLYNFINEPALTVFSGQEVQPVVNFSTDWMHTYIYLDLDNDSTFTVLEPNAGVQPPLSELMSYSFYDEGSNDGTGYNSAGIYQSSTNITALPTLTIPATLDPGIYRMRFKVDWNSIDAGGSTVAANDILRNGGAICDVNVRVESPTGIDSFLLGATGKAVWYDLQGRRIAPPKTSGVYINGNRKVIIK